MTNAAPKPSSALQHLIEVYRHAKATAETAVEHATQSLWVHVAEQLRGLALQVYHQLGSDADVDVAELAQSVSASLSSSPADPPAAPEPAEPAAS